MTAAEHMARAGMLQALAGDDLRAAVALLAQDPDATPGALAELASVLDSLSPEGGQGA